MAWLSDWAKRIKVTIPTTNIANTLTNAEIKLHLSASCGLNNADMSDIFTVLGANKYKIAVTLNDEVTEINAEIVYWDNVGSEALLFANVPSISSVTQTDIYIYYDNTKADNTTYIGDVGSMAGKAVYSSRWKGVYHFAEQPAGVANEVKDSTANVHHGVGVKTGSVVGYPQRVAGVGGSYGMQFDGQTDFANQRGNCLKLPITSDFSQPTTGYLSMLFHFYMPVFEIPTYNDAGNGYVRFLGRQATTAEWMWRVYTKVIGYSVPGTVTKYAYNPTGGLGAGASVNYQNATPQATWQMYASCFRPANFTVWQNVIWTSGSNWFSKRTVTYYYGTTPIVMVDTGNYLSVGCGNCTATNGNGFFTGNIGELWLSNDEISEAFIKFWYYSMNDQLVTYNLPETVYGGSVPVVVQTLPATNPGYNSVTLNGLLSQINTDPSYAVSFDYGLTTGYGTNVTADESPLTTEGSPFSKIITGLLPDTTYHFRTKCVSAGGTVYGSDLTVDTLDPLAYENNLSY